MSMGDGSNFSQLAEGIIARSNARTWEAARAEWQLIYITEGHAETACLCGHNPIKNLCILQNRLNGNTEIVGTVCVKKFLGYRPDLVWDALQRVKADPSVSINGDALEYLLMNKAPLTEWEVEFLSDTMKKRSLSGKQLEIRERVNGKILRWHEGRRGDMRRIYAEAKKARETNLKTIKEL